MPPLNFLPPRYLEPVLYPNIFIFSGKKKKKEKPTFNKIASALGKDSNIFPLTCSTPNKG